MNIMEFCVQVNGESKQWTIAPGDLLLDVLRREGYFGVKRGCESGECGACTVLVNGKPINSCLMFAAQAEGCEILTIEGVEQSGKLDPLQEAFLEYGAVQCGFCTPGMILSAKALLAEHPDPTEAEVREALAGNFCRCTGYLKPVEAVLAAAQVYRAQAAKPQGRRTSQKSKRKSQSRRKDCNNSRKSRWIRALGGVTFAF
jgi:aerobic-type carbon monoxide dehydrogenase small subunit (CoxS/CutS family)